MKRIYLNDPDDTACGLYRAKLPAKFCTAPLAERGIELTCKQTLGLNERYDAYVFHRYMHHSFVEHIETLKKSGGKIVFEWDDDPFKIPRSNPAYALSEEVESVRYCLSLADEVWVSTEPLALRMHEERSEVTIRILPNLMDLSLWDHPIYNAGEPRLLWAGSSSHVEDIRLLAPLVERVPYETYFFGDAPEELSQWVRIKYTNMAVMVPRKDLSHRLRYVDPVDLKNYPATLCALGCNIGLVPLAENEFNQSKSGIKFYELTLAGCLCICSNLPPYYEASMKVGRKIEAWSLALGLAADEKRRMELWRQDFDKVRNTCSWTSEGCQDWIEAFAAL